MRIQLVPGAARRDLLVLPWEQPLEEWSPEWFVEVARGIGRHVVRFCEIGGTLYALKELPQALAEREYHLLRELAHSNVPAVEPVGVVGERGDDLDAVLVTRHLEFSLPYRVVVARGVLPDYWDRLLDALAELLVRLHLAGVYWGDCSLSNALFRRDAGALCAYLVDIETGERHEQLTDGQREHDLEIVEMNVAGELMDLEEELALGGPDPDAVAADICARYTRLWAELTDEETFSLDERYRVDERLRRLNELGFDVEEIELAATNGGYRLRLQSQVVEPGHHRRRLLGLTGLDAQENQARRLLNDLARFRAEVERSGGGIVSEAAVAARWVTEVFEPAIAAIPEDVRGKRAAAELFHELLEHRWYLSEARGFDVGLDEAVRSYAELLRTAPDERAP